MFSPDQLNSLSKIIMEKLGANDTRKCNSDKSHNRSEDKNRIQITPSQALVIMGIITNSLEVNSVLVDRNQEIQILLVGSLKQKTELEKTISAIGKLPFEDVLKAVINNL